MATNWLRFTGIGAVTIAGAVFAAALAWAGQDRSATAAAWNCPAPQALPGFVTFPQAAATVDKWVENRDASATRAHGWRLFAALNARASADGPAVWQSWCTETQAFAQDGATLGAPRRAAHGDRPMKLFKVANGPTARSRPSDEAGDTGEPINFPIHPVYPIPAAVLANRDNPQAAGCVSPPGPGAPMSTLNNGPQYQNNGDVMIAGVIYNPSAFGWIRSNQFYSAQKLAQLASPPGLPSQTSIDEFKRDSIVLKPMLWPVARRGYTALPVWDDQQRDHGLYSGFEVQQQWPRAVAVTADAGTQPATVEVSYLNGVWQGDANNNPIAPLPRNSYRAAPVGVDKFYNYRPDLATLAPCDRALLDASANYAYGRNFEQGDYLVLIAMHIMTKEQRAWTFQSLWWSDRPDAGPYAADRPDLPAAAGPWRNYLMTSTWGWSAQRGGNTWPVAYNPYIELAADHPIATNCMNCHHRAAWQENGTGYLVPGGPSALRMFQQNDPCVFGGLLKVDSLWSIADRVASTPPLPQVPCPPAGGTGAARGR